MKTSRDDHWDFDETPPPYDGLIRSVMRRHGCSWRQALKRMGVRVPERVPFGDLEVGARFRLNQTWWEKIEPETDTWDGHPIRFTARCLGDDQGAIEPKPKDDRAAIADEILVEPFDANPESS